MSYSWLMRFTVGLVVIFWMILTVDLTMGFSLDSVRRLADEGKFDDALFELSVRLTDSPDDLDAHLLYGVLLVRTGAPQKAIETWRSALGFDPSKEKKAQILWQIGQTLMQMAGDGPSAKRIGGVIQYEGKANRDELKEKQWIVEKWKGAAGAFLQMRILYPDDEQLIELGASCLTKAGEADKAAGLWKEVFDKNPKNDKAGWNYGNLLKDEGKLEAARKIVQQILENSQFSALGYRLSSELHEISGEDDLAIKFAVKADFYEWLAPFNDVAFSEKNIETVSGLREGKFAAIKELIRDKTKDSSGILAAVCFKHGAHGEIENSAFKELESRNQTELLVELMERGSSTCTSKQALHALARLKHNETLDFIKAALPQDVRPMWNIDVAGAAVELGDKRAVPFLIEAAAIEFRESDRQLPEEEASFLGNGPLIARLRAVNALGYFGVPEAKLALEKGLENPDIFLTCQVALCRLDGTEERWKKIEEGLMQMETVQQKFAAIFASELSGPQAEAIKKRMAEEFGK